MPIIPTRLRVKDLTPLPQEADLVNKIFEVENPIGSPTDQNYQVSFATVVQAVSNNLPGPNDSKSLVKAARVYDLGSGGSPGDATLVGLNPDFLCLYALCYVEFPRPSRVYRLVYSTTGPLQVWRDPTFTGQKVGAQWVEVNSLEESAGDIDDFSPFAIQYPQGAVVKFTTGGRLRIFSAKSTLVKSAFANNQIPTPTGEATDANWQEINPVGATANIRDFLPGSYKQDDLVVFNHQLHRAKQDLVIADFNDGSGNYDNFPDLDYWEIVGDGASIQNPYDDTALAARVTAVEGSAEYLAITLGENYNELSGRITSIVSLAPDYAPGTYTKGQFVTSNGKVFTAKQNIQNSQVAPSASNVYWLQISSGGSGGAVQNSLIPSSSTDAPSVDAVVAGLAQKTSVAYVDSYVNFLQDSISTERIRLDNLVSGAPQALDTLAEIAGQIAADEQGTAAILATQNQHTQQLAVVVKSVNNTTPDQNGNVTVASGATAQNSLTPASATIPPTVNAVTGALATKADLVGGFLPVAQLPIATSIAVGGVKIGANLGINAAGTLNAISQVQNNLTASTTTAPSVTAVNTGLAGKADVASPTLTGTPTGPTAAAGTNTTQLATTAFAATAAANAANAAVAAKQDKPSTTNTTYGAGAGSGITSATGNTLIGSYAGTSLSSGGDHTLIGKFAGAALTTGNSCTFIGSAAGQKATGSNLILIGQGAGFNVTSAANTCIIGYNAGQLTTTGSGCTFFGSQAGYNVSTGANHTALGFNSGPVTGTLTNTTAIGYNAKPTIDNTVILGDAADANNKIGIGTTNPASKVHVVGDVECTAFVMKSPNGTRFRVTMNNDGTFLSTAT